MPRLAAIDIGTNTVLLCVADLGPAGLAPVADSAIISRLGQGLDRSGELHPDAIARTLAALDRHAAEAAAAGAARVAVVGTAALRRARNAGVFLDEAKRRLGLEVAVISGEEEARLAFEAVARSREEDGAAAGRILVLDIGGGSTEVIAGEGRRLDWARSLDLGSVRLTERFLIDDPPPAPQRQALIAHVRTAFEGLPEPPGAGPMDLVGIAGTNTTLAAMKAGLRVYDAEAIRRTPITPSDLDELIGRLSRMPAAARLALPGLEPGREDVILAGAVIAREALARFRMAAMSVSDRGVRHGVIYRMAVPGGA